MMCGAPMERISSSGPPWATIPPVVDDGDPVAQHVRLVHVVRSQQDGAPGGPVALQHRPQLPPRLRIQPGGRLVEEEQLRIADQGAADGQTLPLPAGQLADPAPALAAQLQTAPARRLSNARADRTTGTAGASRSPSASRRAAIPGGESRAAPAARRRPRPTRTPGPARVRHPARAAPPGSRWSWSSRRRSDRAGRSTRRAAPPGRDRRPPARCRSA